MAIYKTISSKVVIRKIFRDINPNTDNWVDDAIEWIGEALEHIGSAPQLIKKNCVLEIKDYKAALPNDLFYINQVAINETAEGVIISEQIDTLLYKIDIIINSGVTSGNTLNQINTSLHILESQYAGNDNLTVLNKCQTNFPTSTDCPDCVKGNNAPFRCYYTEADKIKTSAAIQKLCLSYMAFPVDDDCFPLVPDDISFKEAMFWYVYKKMLLGNMAPSQNGIGYEFAEMQWKYYCTQARNAANFPDIDGYESFMDQWVRLIPNINRHSEGFATLNERESLSRGKYEYLVDNMPVSSSAPTKAAATNLTRRTTVINWVINTADAVEVGSGLNNVDIVLNNPLTGDYNIAEGSVTAVYGTTFWTLSNLTAVSTITYTYTIDVTPNTAGNIEIEVVMLNTQTGAETIVGDTVYAVTAGTTQISGAETTVAGSTQSAQIFIRIPEGSNNTQVTGIKIASANLKIE